LNSPASPSSDSSSVLTQARASAIFEIVLCSGVPSQFALAFMLAWVGFKALDGEALSFGYVTTLLLLDTTIMIALIFWFLRRHGEHPRNVFLGTQSVRRELWIGVSMIAVVFMLAIVVLSLTRLVFPVLHNVRENPLQELISTPSQALAFALVATIGGGFREEIQRAFILHRFEQHLGGGRVGLIMYSLIFGLGHSLQGWDAVLTTTILGLFWGMVYLRRRNIIAPVVSHSGFNAMEIFVYLIGGR
jgi:membrane protease YdiL (CAAX protease family)